MGDHSNTYLSITWSVSRGRDTYGYNICRLDDQHTGKRYKCTGGGYDMIGTVVADWLVDQFQDRLLKIKHRAFSHNGPDGRRHGLYGMRLVVPAPGDGDPYVTLDGACGIESVREVARAIGVELQWTGNRRGTTTGYIATWSDEWTQD